MMTGFLTAPWGELATRWTVRLALAGYFGGAALRLSKRSSRGERMARILWSAGLALYVMHVACAFHYYHAWSHAAAYQHTAERTAALTGRDWGGGIYFNYLFTALWAADAIALWLWPEAHRGRRLVGWPVQAFLWFMVFNATAVFGQGMIRWLGLAGCAWLVVLAVLAGRRFARRAAWR